MMGPDHQPLVPLPYLHHFGGVVKSIPTLNSGHELGLPSLGPRPLHLSISSLHHHGSADLALCRPIATTPVDKTQIVNDSRNGSARNSSAQTIVGIDNNLIIGDS